MTMAGLRFGWFALPHAHTSEMGQVSSRLTRSLSKLKICRRYLLWLIFRFFVCPWMFVFLVETSFKVLKFQCFFQRILFLSFSFTNVFKQSDIVLCSLQSVSCFCCQLSVNVSFDLQYETLYSVVKIWCRVKNVKTVSFKDVKEWYTILTANIFFTHTII